MTRRTMRSKLVRKRKGRTANPIEQMEQWDTPRLAEWVMGAVLEDCDDQDLSVRS